MPSDAALIRLASIAANVEDLLAADYQIEKAPVGLRTVKNDRRRTMEAILVLLASGNVLAKQDGKELGGPKELLPTQIGKLTLYKEDEPPTATQRAAVRGLMVDAGVPYEPGQEGSQLPALLHRLKDLAARNGGAPPFPIWWMPRIPAFSPPLRRSPRRPRPRSRWYRWASAPTRRRT